MTLILKNGFILVQLWKIIHVTVIQKDKLFFKEGIRNGQMRIYIRRLMRHILYFGENDRQYYYFLYDNIV